MNYRKATENDIDEIIKLIQNRIDWMDKNNIKQWNCTDYLNVYPFEYFKKNIQFFLVATENNKIVSALALYDFDERWNNNDNALYIHHLVSDINSKGAGSKLLMYAEQFAKKKKVKYLRLDSAIDNKNLEQFYSKLGYKPCGTCIDGPYIGIKREKQI